MREPLPFAEGLCQRRTSFGFLFFVLLAVGLATTSLSNLLFLLVVCGVAYVVISIAPRFRRDPQAPLVDRLLTSRPLHLFLIAAAALTPAVSYQLAEGPFFYLKPTTLRPGLPLTVQPGGGGTFGNRDPRQVAERTVRDAGRMVRLDARLLGPAFRRSLAGLISGPRLSGQYTLHQSREPRLLDQLHHSGLLTGLRQEMPFPNNGPVVAKYFRDARERSWPRMNPTYNDYCRDGSCFFGAYGLIYLLALGSYLMLEDKSREIRPAAKPDGSSTESNFQWTLLLLFLVGLLPVLLFHMDFIDNAPRAWIKSRFLEIPVYGILFIFFCPWPRREHLP